MKEIKEIGYLGPEGSFSHEAVILYGGKNCFQKPHPSIGSIIEAVAREDLDEGIIPFENYLDGSISSSLDSLVVTQNIFINAEVVISIRQNLIGICDLILTQIEKVVSKREAIDQCLNWIKNNLPNLKEVISVNSTSEAVRELNKYGHSQATVAIGSELAARLYRRVVIEKDIQDSKDNVTRFVVISRGNQNEVTGNDKTSIILTLVDRPGSLVDALEPFKRSFINLTMIISRPTKKKMGEYLFFIDFNGHCKEEKVQKVLREVGRSAKSLRILGSYPVWQENGQKRK